MGFLGDSEGKESTCNAGDLGLIPGFDDPLEKRTTTHSSILAWRIPWTEESGGLQAMGLERVRHDWARILYTTMLCTIFLAVLRLGTINLAIVRQPWERIRRRAWREGSPRWVVRECLFGKVASELWLEGWWDLDCSRLPYVKEAYRWDTAACLNVDSMLASVLLLHIPFANTQGKGVSKSRWRFFTDWLNYGPTASGEDLETTDFYLGLELAWVRVQRCRLGRENEIRDV